MAYESVYEDGEEEGLFVRGEDLEIAIDERERERERIPLIIY